MNEHLCPACREPCECDGGDHCDCPCGDVDGMEEVYDERLDTYHRENKIGRWVEDAK